MNAEVVADIIESSARGLAEWTVGLQEERDPSLHARLGAGGLTALRADTQVRVMHLAAAVAFDEPTLLSSHASWAAASYASRGAPIEILEDNFRCMADVARERLGASESGLALAPIEEAIEALRGDAEVAIGLEGKGDDVALTRRYVVAILEGERGEARALVEQAMDAGMGLDDVYARVLQPAHIEIGRLWQVGEISVGEEHLASASSEWVASHLALKAPRAEPKGRTVIATTVSGDTHSFGVRLVADSFENDGWRTFYLGASTPAPDVVQTIVDRSADLLALSANLGCHVREAKRTVDAIRATPQTRGVRVIVGGPPFSAAPTLWKKVGADGFADSARGAVAEGNRLLG